MSNIIVDAEAWLAGEDRMDGYDVVDLIEQLVKQYKEVLEIAKDLYDACDNEGLREACPEYKKVLENSGVTDFYH